MIFFKRSLQADLYVEVPIISVNNEKHMHVVFHHHSTFNMLSTIFSDLLSSMLHIENVFQNYETTMILCVERGKYDIE